MSITLWPCRLMSTANRMTHRVTELGFTVLQRSQRSIHPQFNRAPLGSGETGIHITEVQPMNLQQRCDAIVLKRTKISEECFQHLVESMIQKRQEVLRSKRRSNLLLQPQNVTDIHQWTQKGVSRYCRFLVHLNVTAHTKTNTYTHRLNRGTMGRLWFVLSPHANLITETFLNSLESCRWDECSCRTGDPSWSDQRQPSRGGTRRLRSHCLPSEAFC